MADTFTWYELVTPDPAAARTFYGAVIGWSMSDHSPSVMPYTILSAGTHGVGGIMQLPDEAGARPGWFGYIGVDDTDACARRIADAGGRILRAPDDIPDVGRFAVVADPGDAPFMLLTPLPRGDAPPPAAPATPGTIGWHELNANNGQDAAFAFYSKQFGWSTLSEMDMGEMGKYRIFGVDDVQLGGMMDKSPQSPFAGWLFYVNIDSVDAAVERITTRGGRVLMGPMEVPGGSWIVQATDPQGVMFALVSPQR
jgi:uncharacterized protein